MLKEDIVALAAVSSLANNSLLISIQNGELRVGTSL